MPNIDLFSTSSLVNEVTIELERLILSFLFDYSKYFGKVFIYEG